jgi:hypothetical protein
MEDIYWLATFIAGTICTGTGMLAWRLNPDSKATKIFFVATITTTIAMLAARVADGIGEADRSLAITASKVFSSSLLVSLALYWNLTTMFPVELRISFRPLNSLGAVIVTSWVISIGLGLTARPDFVTSVGTTVISKSGAVVVLGGFLSMVVLAAAFSFHSRAKATESAKHTSTIYLIGLCMVTVSGVVYSADIILGHRHGSAAEPIARLSLICTVTAVMIYFAYSMARGSMTISVTPRAEKLSSATKSRYNLLPRRVYLVEERKPDFGMSLFADILKGRCYDCENDDSFLCESLDCGSCNLPCPCKKCDRYKTRTQGLMITRLQPNDVRAKLFLQTTPIMWLSTVAGKDNMDPAKLSVLTDFLVSSMEKSQNGIVLVDGIEYLLTSNDFSRVLRAMDRWTETAMTNSIRLIITLDPNAFDEKELAMLEKNKEVVRPGSKDSWRVIPQPM